MISDLKTSSDGLVLILLCCMQATCRLQLAWCARSSGWQFCQLFQRLSAAHLCTRQQQAVCRRVERPFQRYYATAGIVVKVQAALDAEAVPPVREISNDVKCTVSDM